MTSIRLSGRKARLQGCSSPLTIVWTSTTPFTETGVDERDACARTVDGALAIAQAMIMKSTNVGCNSLARQLMNKIADFTCDMLHSPQWYCCNWREHVC